MAEHHDFVLEENNIDPSLLDVGVRIGEIIQASNLCLKNKFPSAAVSLIYIALDTAASLDHSLRKERPGARFVKWADKCILRNGSLRCSALDLYAARCGLLHTYSPRSNLSSKGRVREIWYTFDDHEADMLRKAASKLDLKQVIVVSLDSLTVAVAKGVTAFISDLERDQVLAHWAKSKAKETFQFIESVNGKLSPFPILKDLEALSKHVHEQATKDGR